MATTRELDKLVDQCLEEIQAGKRTLEECLERHAGCAEALKPLLELAAHSHNILAPSSPRKTYVHTSGSRILNQIKISDRRPAQPLRFQPVTGWLRLKPAYVLAAIALVIALLGSGIGVVRASADALPGDRLYRAKLVGEQIQLAMSLSAKGDHGLLITFAEKRLTEADALLVRERYEDLDQALQGLDDALIAIAELEVSEEDKEPGSLDHIEDKLKKHQEVLQAVLESVPESARSAIERAVERSSRSEEVIQKVKSGDHPGDHAPGQLKKNGEADKDPPGRGNGLDKEKPEKPEKKEKPDIFDG